LSVGLRPFFDNSFMTHLATGRLILDDGFPRHDVYSFTAAGEPWVVQSWLASVAYAGIERLAGTNAIHLLTAALGAALGVISYLLTRPAEQLLSRLLVGGACMLVGASTWSERPLQIGLVGLGLVLLALEQRMHPAWLLPVMWVWANSHGSHPLAVVACVTFALGRRLDGDAPREELRVLVYVVAGMALAVIGPLGLRVLTFPVELLGRMDVLRYLIEWGAPGFDDVRTRLFLGLVVLGVVGLVRRPSYRAAVPFVVFLALALVSERNIAPAALVFTPVLASCWGGVGQLSGTQRSPVATIGVVAIALMGAVLVQARLTGPVWNFEIYPLRALAFTAERGWLPADDGVRVLTEDTVGNLREAMHGPGDAVFMDDRLDMYPSELVDDYLELSRGRPGWSEVLDRHAIDVIVWPAAQPLGSLVAGDDAWHVAYQDGEFFVACRRTLPDCVDA